MRVLIPVVWGVAIALLMSSDAGFPVWLAVLQATVVASYGLVVSGGPATRPLIRAVEHRIVTTAAAVAQVVDVVAIDGTIDGVGLVVRGWSTLLRRAQAGSARLYAVAMLAGIVAMLGYVLWR